MMGRLGAAIPVAFARLVACGGNGRPGDPEQPDGVLDTSAESSDAVSEAGRR